jgi:UDP-N-acetylmuramoyl-tripeptide--D-alanyl-D-alanine ligase
MMSLAQAQAALGQAHLAARIRGAADVHFTSVSTDTRTLDRGALYVALRGPRFDGHAFARAAAEGGAAALLVEHELPLDLPQLVVDDSRAALGWLAAHWRACFSLSLIAVTGSNGKTTTTQMVASILAHAFGRSGEQQHWFATRGNRNNEIGVPQMLFELRAGHRVAVLELGMNHPGEIERLSQWSRPTVALVTNAQREHQEFLESVEATARENGQVIRALSGDGVAVFPADDACAPVWRELAGARRVMDFALTGEASVRARYRLQPQSSELELLTPLGAITTTLALGGEHNVRNALAAGTACLAAGIGPEAVAAGLAAFRPVAGRGTRLALPGGVSLIDESYNANPDSVRAAIDLLAQQPGRRVLVFGDMGEVGPRADEFHREIGRYAQQRGIDQLLTLGEQAQTAAVEFGAGARHFDTAEALGTAATSLAATSTDASAPLTILVKGSRFMRLERVIGALVHAANATAAASRDTTVGAPRATAQEGMVPGSNGSDGSNGSNGAAGTHA